MYRILFILLFCTSPLFAQRANDISYIPKDNSVVISQTVGRVGIYVGGQYFTSYPYQYFYYTPYPLLNRFGGQIRVFKDVNLMVGGYVPHFGLTSTPNPMETELWVKTGLFNTITQEINPYDVVISVKVSKEFYYGLGIYLQW